MTVQQLINLLNQIEDKDIPLFVDCDSICFLDRVEILGVGVDLFSDYAFLELETPDTLGLED